MPGGQKTAIRKIPAQPVGSVPVLRALDAAANRAAEGLRVAEDYLRFVLDDPHLTACCKRLRHQLHTALESIATSDRLAARETQADVGTAINVPGEQTRNDPWNVCVAGFRRAEQSLRSLEEFAKTWHPPLAATLEQLRYETYTVERAAGMTTHSLDRLARAQLCVLVDGGASEANFTALVESLVAAEVAAIQLRAKSLTDRRLLRRARILRRATQGTSTLVIVNDRPDVAVASHADGVHLGQDDFSVKDARTVMGPTALIGVSTHSLDQAHQAVLDGANYLGVGPTFPSQTKSFDAFPGLELAQAVGRQIRLPAFAIGGIHGGNLAQVLGAGLQRIAVSAAVTTAEDPCQAARELIRALRAGDAFPTRHGGRNPTEPLEGSMMTD